MIALDIYKKKAIEIVSLVPLISFETLSKGDVAESTEYGVIPTLLPMS